MTPGMATTARSKGRCIRLVRLTAKVASMMMVQAVMAEAATPELRTLFPYQAQLYAGSGRLSRLELPPDVISQCRSDLSDLRVFDSEGNEVPFLVDGGLPAGMHFEVKQRSQPRLLDVSQQRVDRDDAPALWRERYRIAAPPEASATGFWDLVIETRRRSFVRRYLIATAAEDGSPVPLIEGSVFRLTDPPREVTRLTLPAFSGELAVSFEGEDGAYLEPTFRYENARSLPASGRATVVLQELSRRSVPGKTSLELARPRGLVPDLLLLETASGAFNRPVEVWDEGPGAADDALGSENVFRIRAAITVEDLEVAVRPARGARLRLVIADGDSPPLDDPVIRAVVRRPAVIVSLPVDDPAEPAGVLRFGGGRAYPPQYDLATLRTTAQVTGTDARVAEQLHDPALLGEVRLATIEANPHFDAGPVLAFAHRSGSEIDARLYSQRRQLDVVPSAEGLARLELTLDDLAAAREDLADVRIVDEAGRQWAYLLERDHARHTRGLTHSLLDTEDGTSRYALPFPAQPATVDEVVLETQTPYFDRAFELKARLCEDQIHLADGRLVRRIGDPRPVAIRFASRRVDSLELWIEDGDDAPLPFDRVAARFAVAELYLAAPAGRYELLVGYPGARPPRYELARVRDVVLAVASSDVEVSALEENPAFSSRSRLSSDDGLQRLVLWVILGLAVVVLTLLTLRLARRDPPAAEQ